MKETIRTHINDPKELEKLYRVDKTAFKSEFTTLYPELKGHSAADFWYERLHFEGDEIKWGTGKELSFVIMVALMAGIIAKLPVILSIGEEFFYTRNIGFIAIPPLLSYFAWKNRLSAPKIVAMAALTLVGVVFINLLPNSAKSDTLVLSCIHLVLFLWCILGFAFVGEIRQNAHKRLLFLSYNGDLVVISTLIIIAGGLMTAITIGLFSLIGFNIENFYSNYVVVFGLSAVPIVGTYLTRVNPQLVGKVSPVIAKIFSPLVLVMLVIYLAAIVYSGKDPYNDRDFLLMFNALLVGVLAIIFFSIAETSKSVTHKREIWVLFLLSVLTVVINGIALSAILFRISEWGITPNRAAVLGSNVLVLINLLWVTIQLFKVISKKTDIAIVGKAIVSYLPVYFIWTIVVTFLFPWLFGFK